jgi:hypothetical protein
MRATHLLTPLFTIALVTLVLASGCSDVSPSPRHQVGDRWRHLSGHIRDRETATPIAGATAAAVRSVDAHVWSRDTTNAEGYYAGYLGGLPVGFPADGYLLFEHTGYESVIVSIDSVFTSIYQEEAVFDVALPLK